MKLAKLLFSLMIFSTITATAAPHQKTPCDQQILTSDHQDYDYVSFNQSSIRQGIEKRRIAGITPSSINHAKYLQNAFGVVTKPTPFYTNQHLNKIAATLLGHTVSIYLKDETVNPTGSFKDRMPIRFYNRVLNSADHTKLKLVAVSTGNHGRAVSYAANRGNIYLLQHGLQHHSKITAEITMPADALPHKKVAIAKLGASIRDHANGKAIPSYDAAENMVLQEANNDSEHTLLLPHADDNSINGYAVISAEMMQQAAQYGINLAKSKPGEVMMLVPLGSGGLLSGTEEISARYPNVYSIGVTAAPADMTYRSLRHCKMIRSAKSFEGKLIVDGVMATPEKYSLERIREISKGVALVRQEDAVYATALLKQNGITVEPSSALPLAALLLGIGDDFKHVRSAFIVLTGKNIAADMEIEISKMAKESEAKIMSYFAGRRLEIAQKSHHL